MLCCRERHGGQDPRASEEKSSRGRPSRQGVLAGDQMRPEKLRPRILDEFGSQSCLSRPTLPSRFFTPPWEHAFTPSPTWHPTVHPTPSLFLEGPC